jgi:hypothetical protein
MPGKGRGQRNSPSIGVMARRWSELGPVVFGGINVAAVADGDRDASL